MRTTEPTEIIKGERVEWTRCLADYPASLWTLKYRFRNTGVGVNVTCTAEGDDHLAVLAADVSDNFTVLGRAKWQAWIEEIADATNTFVVDQGECTIVLGFVDDVAAVETRSTARIMLETIDAAMLAFAASDVLEYEIQTPAGSRRVKRSDKATLTAERKYWAGIVANEDLKERMKNGGPFAKPVRVRMYER